jgi:hypothetical protein
MMGVRGLDAVEQADEQTPLSAAVVVTVIGQEGILTCGKQEFIGDFRRKGHEQRMR